MEHSFTLSDRHLKPITEGILSERNYDQYKKFLDLTEEELANWHTIVDLGAGTEQEFAKGIRVHHPEAKVISIDPRLALSEEEDLAGILPEDHDARRRGRQQPEPETIAALAQDLPIDSNSVDGLVALHSVPQYIETTEGMNDAFREILRVLKAGGVAKLFPVNKDRDWATKIFPFLEAQGKTLDYDLVLKERVGDDEKYLMIIRKRASAEIN
jgi:SAM-dependent methyltransferase